MSRKDPSFIFTFICLRINAGPFWRISGPDFYRRGSLRVKPIKMERLRSRFAFIRYILAPFLRSQRMRSRKGGKDFLSRQAGRRKMSSAGVMRDETTALLLSRQLRWVSARDICPSQFGFDGGLGNFSERKIVGNSRQRSWHWFSVPTEIRGNGFARGGVRERKIGGTRFDSPPVFRGNKIYFNSTFYYGAFDYCVTDYVIFKRRARDVGSIKVKFGNFELWHSEKENNVEWFVYPRFRLNDANKSRSRERESQREHEER